MDIKALEAKIVELKGKQAAYFQTKKADRNAAELEAVRKEMNELKAQATAHLRGLRKSK